MPDQNAALNFQIYNRNIPHSMSTGSENVTADAQGGINQPGGWYYSSDQQHTFTYALNHSLVAKQTGSDIATYLCDGSTGP